MSSGTSNWRKKSKISDVSLPTSWPSLTQPLLLGTQRLTALYTKSGASTLQQQYAEVLPAARVRAVERGRCMHPKTRGFPSPQAARTPQTTSPKSGQKRHIQWRTGALRHSYRRRRSGSPYGQLALLPIGQYHIRNRAIHRLASAVRLPKSVWRWQRSTAAKIHPRCHAVL